MFLSGQEHIVTESVDYITLSKKMLSELKKGNDISHYHTLISNSTEDGLIEQLDSDAKRYAFWINIYNAYIIKILTEDASLYEDRRGFFKKPFIKVAGREMSFANIEHGILRRSEFEYFLGYLRNPFAPKYQKRLRPEASEYRIHFALNCGAKSCPPVNIYDPETLDAQLDEMQLAYLTRMTSYLKDERKVVTTPLASWFRGDFGGKGGVKEILWKLGLIPHTQLDLSFGDYDWTLDINNYF